MFGNYPNDLLRCQITPYSGGTVMNKKYTYSKIAKYYKYVLNLSNTDTTRNVQVILVEYKRGKIVQK
jgi:hypothetical protein